MPRKINYNKGQKLGPYNTIFLYDTKTIKYKRYAMFRCSFCNSLFEAEISKIKNGSTKGCGCQRGKQYKDLIGQRFGFLTILEKTEKRDSGNSII